VHKVPQIGPLAIINSKSSTGQLFDNSNKLTTDLYPNNLMNGPISSHQVSTKYLQPHNFDLNISQTTYHETQAFHSISPLELNTVASKSTSNSVNNISSLRTDPGVCSLSTYVGANTLNLYSSYTKLNQSVITITQQNLSMMQVYYLLSTSDSVTYSNNNPTSQITSLSNQIVGFSNYIPTAVAPYTIQTSKYKIKIVKNTKIMVYLYLLHHRSID
jgi:hypothetical protein